jgi:hypothetical protein
MVLSAQKPFFLSTLIEHEKPQPRPGLKKHLEAAG